MDYTKVAEDMEFHEKLNVGGVTFRPALTRDYIHAKYKKFNFRVYQDRTTKKYKGSISNGMVSLQLEPELFDSPENVMIEGIKLIDNNSAMKK